MNDLDGVMNKIKQSFSGSHNYPEQLRYVEKK